MLNLFLYYTISMEKEVQKLKDELERLRFQLYFFYELTKAMRITLRLEEITYIILTGLTAHEGLGFNRAVIFFLDNQGKRLNGYMGIGPMDAKDASEIWHHIEEAKKDLYDLIDDYNRIKDNKNKPRFMKFVQSLSFSIVKKNNLIKQILKNKYPVQVKKSQIKNYKDIPLIKKLNLKECLISPVWIKDEPAGLIVVDNYITKKPITEDDLKIFSMFIDQATGALENSQSFENTLTQAHTDSLTSLWNYGYFQYKLDEELVAAQASKLPLSVMMIDVDDFKKFNDAQGHLQGDAALRHLSAILKENCRKIDIVCRYGGEEFALILPTNNKQEAAPLGERIRKSVEEKLILDSRFTVSIGIASFPQDSLDKKTLIKKADQALYDAKRKGKNRVEIA
ncbi:MAG: sensor domain-containing diguanylate cyclase [Candidatus Omnitrophica bacterium]|nr:sensor domain-containing diguanylate cyclase [Candidatus Omnitrophota bacterium]